MREASRQQARAEQRALVIAVAWMLAVQLACVALWDAGWLGRQAALIHWLIVGVLPPAFALWGMRHEDPEEAHRPQ
jgi:fatty acid desaturase